MTEIAAILAERTRRLASRTSDTQAPPAPDMLVCAIGGERYGFAVAAVDEVLAYRAPLPVPGGTPGILGILGRAGEVIAAFDGAVILGLAPNSSPPASVVGGHFIVLAGPPAVAIRVDRALGIAPAENRTPPPADRPAGPVTGLATAPAGRLAPEAMGFAILAAERLLAALDPTATAADPDPSSRQGSP